MTLKKFYNTFSAMVIVMKFGERDLKERPIKL